MIIGETETQKIVPVARTLGHRAPLLMVAEGRLYEGFHDCRRIVLRRSGTLERTETRIDEDILLDCFLDWWNMYCGLSV